MANLKSQISNGEARVSVARPYGGYANEEDRTARTRKSRFCRTAGGSCGVLVVAGADKVRSRSCCNFRVKFNRLCKVVYGFFFTLYPMNYRRSKL
ncbi:hypothetical protein [Microcoleus sp. D2_18a_D3]|uniref:hypothetical protein n=1 Tax=Microcoleus sp. D2_18a_D3 TaxID=3055330 RepID=UPI002FD1303E